MSAVRPDLSVEKSLILDGYLRVAAMDEVGRGCVAGMASVGVVVVDATVAEPEFGVKDSKLLSSAKRESFVEQIKQWAVSSAVGHASASEVDDLGILGALRLAGLRALGELDVAPDVVLLDGSYDWLSCDGLQIPVVMKVKADMSCSAVAAASVLAKVERDALIDELALTWPGYGWETNRGYGTKAHLEAIRELGACPEHRKTFNLTGVKPDKGGKQRRAAQKKAS